MSPLKNTAIALFCALLAGCVHGPPIQYYTLAPAPGRVWAQAPKVPVQIAAIHLPATLDCKQLVRERSATQVEIDDGAHWAAPLEKIVANVLTRDLQQRYGAGAVLMPTAARAPGTLRIVLDILHFGPTPAAATLLDGSFTLLRGEEVLGHYPLHVDLPAPGGDASAQAQAMSAALGAAADQIAAQIAATGG